MFVRVSSCELNSRRFFTFKTWFELYASSCASLAVLSPKNKHNEKKAKRVRFEQQVTDFTQFAWVLSNNV